jgi:non-ribosomal peptide synthetase component F
MRPITSNSCCGAADWQRDAAIAAGVTLDALFRRAFRIFADRTAVTWENWQRRCREIGERAWQLANALRAKGYDRGDTIAILSQTRLEPK